MTSSTTTTTTTTTKYSSSCPRNKPLNINVPVFLALTFVPRVLVQCSALGVELFSFSTSCHVCLSPTTVTERKTNGVSLTITRHFITAKEEK
ncbi:hypothetical protein E2C01_068573 [Portunus trituberculatus]|uniref:Uncharacterized protein n=1 Tax=Portunus trituberculatus TaxID=210409 RepID=A0A5B7HP62_PORTR|nr:hypothetical protein [Portunus trituberculatus]